MAVAWQSWKRQRNLTEELCNLLLQGGEGDNPVTQWFQGHKNEKEKRLISYESDVFVSHYHPKSVIHKLLHVLRECMLSHQWDKAAQVLTSVSKGPQDTSDPLWKCGLELMQNDPEDGNQDLIRNLYNQMKYLTDLNCHEVVLDFLMYLLKRDDLEAAKEIIQENIIHHGLKKEITDGDIYMQTLFKGYSGLVWYVEWQRCRHSLEQYQSTAEQESGSQAMSSQSSSAFLEMQMKNFSQKAVACFEALENQVGVWDIFIRKHVELLVYYERFDEALKLLNGYRDANTENPNALKYLYSFYSEHYPDSEITHTVLKEIVQRLPANPLVLEYCSRIEKDKEETVLPHLFKLLDYPCWQADVTPWKLLADSLDKLLHRSSNKAESLSIVRGCWNPRKSWWPKYHFNKYQTEDQSSTSGVNFHKSRVASLLRGFDGVGPAEDNKRTEKRLASAIKPARKFAPVSKRRLTARKKPPKSSNRLSW